VKRLNLCIVTEFVKNGSLRDILANNSVKLAWAQKLKLLHSAARDHITPLARVCGRVHVRLTRMHTTHDTRHTRQDTTIR
jgi:hypothetical protein